MDDHVDFIVTKNKEYSQKQIEFTPYCKIKMDQRGVEKETVINLLFSDKKPLFAELQKVMFQGRLEERHKAVYRLSSRYLLIIIINYDKSLLKVINVIKTSKDLEKQWRKKILK